ncbi:MAG: carboxypeptidase regulatory-like domain-containing protein [Calditrichaeota bacterium]|nr:MAG: carboxypeptidase regulatory-like domain-containing protein [Calditrichota bacterium]
MVKNRIDSALLKQIATIAMKEFNIPDLYVALLPLELKLSREHIEILQHWAEYLAEDQELNGNDVKKLIEISRIVDCIQSRNDPDTLDLPEYSSPGFLSEAFLRIIKNIEFMPEPLNDQQIKKYENAKKILYKDDAYPFVKTEEYNEFCMLRVQISRLEIRKRELLRQKGENNELNRGSNIDDELNQLGDLIKEKEELMAALNDQFQFQVAEEIIRNVELNMNIIPPSIKKAIDTISLFEMTEPVNNITHIICSFFPSVLSEENWIPLRLTSKDFSQITFEHEAEEHSSGFIQDDDIEVIELEVQSLICVRPWFWPALFEKPNWKWKKKSPPVSTGVVNSTSREELIPAYVFALIFARNISIRLKPHAQNKIPASIQLSSPLLQKLISWRAKDVPISSFSSSNTIISLSEIAKVLSLSTTWKANTKNQPKKHKIQLNVLMPKTILKNFATGPAVNIHASYFSVRRDVIEKYVAKGHVIDEMGQPVYNATIEIENSKIRRKVTTGRNGEFCVSDLRPGRYDFFVEKSGFSKAKGAVTLPQKGQLSIKLHSMPQNKNKIIIQLQQEKDEPFTGIAKVIIARNQKVYRYESMVGRSEAVFYLPHGNFSISIQSPGAQSITPQSIPLKLHDSTFTERTLKFKISNVSTIIIPGVQLLAFICRWVPPCPKAD